MPGGVEYMVNGLAKKVYFPVPRATLPILTNEGGLIMLPWGRRNEESGLLPRGGWARLSSIKQTSIWSRFHPVPVKLPFSGWMEKDSQGRSHYFPIANNQCLQGLVATLGNESRVYLVTVGATKTVDIHARAPRVIEVSKPQSMWRVETTALLTLDPEGFELVEPKSLPEEE